MASPTPTPTPAPSAYDPSSPVTHELHLPKEAEEWLQTLSPSTFKSYQDIQGTWNHPMTQFTITLVNDPLFTGAVTEMAQQHAFGRYVGYEAILIVFDLGFEGLASLESVDFLDPTLGPGMGRGTLLGAFDRCSTLFSVGVGI